MDDNKILYNKFLVDKNSYNLNVGYWRRKLQKELNEKFTINDLLFKNRDKDGKNLYDGNPIFSYYSKTKNKAVRIIQEDPEELYKRKNIKKIKFVEGWISKLRIPISKDRDIEVDEFVISIFLSQSSIKKCMELVKEWFNGDLNRNNIKTKINNQ